MELQEAEDSTVFVRLNILDCNFFIDKESGFSSIIIYMKVRFISFPTQLRLLQLDIWVRSYIG